MYNFLAGIAHRWRDVAINLGLHKETESIDVDGHDSQSKLRRVLLKWERNNAEESPYTWRTIINALKQPTIGENALAKKISDYVLSK